MWKITFINIWKVTHICKSNRTFVWNAHRIILLQVQTYIQLVLASGVKTSFVRAEYEATVDAMLLQTLFTISRRVGALAVRLEVKLKTGNAVRGRIQNTV